MRSKRSPWEVKRNKALFNQVKYWGCEATNAWDQSCSKNTRSLQDLVLEKFWEPIDIECNCSITFTNWSVLKDIETKRVRTSAWIAN